MLLSNNPGSTNSGPLDDISANKRADSLTDGTVIFARMQLEIKLSVWILLTV